MGLASATTVGNGVNVAMQTSIVASSILPIAGGVSTSAILLISFLAEVDVYKYINVPFPEKLCYLLSANRRFSPSKYICGHGHRQWR